MVAVLIFLILEKIQNSFPKINMVGALCIISLKKKKLPTWTEKYAFYFQSQIARFCVVWRDTRIIFNVWFSGVIQLWRVFNEGSNLIRLICKFLSITWWNYVWLKLKKKKKKITANLLQCWMINPMIEQTIHITGWLDPWWFSCRRLMLLLHVNCHELILACHHGCSQTPSLMNTSLAPAWGGQAYKWYM